MYMNNNIITMLVHVCLCIGVIELTRFLGFVLLLYLIDKVLSKQQ